MDSRGGHHDQLPTRPVPYPRYDGSQPCLQIGPEAFVIPGDQHQDNAAAKRVCRSCPFLDACHEFAVSYDVVGVWGGTTYADRRRTRRKLGIAAIAIVQPDARTAVARVRQLDDGTLTKAELAERIGCSIKTVERARAVAA